MILDLDAEKNLGTRGLSLSGGRAKMSHTSVDCDVFLPLEVSALK